MPSAIAACARSTCVINIVQKKNNETSSARPLLLLQSLPTPTKHIITLHPCAHICVRTVLEYWCPVDALENLRALSKDALALSLDAQKFLGATLTLTLTPKLTSASPLLAAVLRPP